MLALLSGSGWTSGANGAAAAPRYIVVYRDTVSAKPKTAALERSLGFVSDFRYYDAVKGFAARLDEQQLARIETDPDVAYVTEDVAVRAADALSAGESTPTGTLRIAATSPTTSQGAAGVNVAVIDTGIDLRYGSELNAVAGTNCVSPGSSPQDDNGHGTHVAGTIAARNTGTGVVGVAPGTKVYAVKVLSASGSGTWAQVICGVDWVTRNAAALNIKVASMSLGGWGSNDGNCGNSNGDAFHRAICSSVAAGVSYVVAAGNSGVSFSSFVPAAYPEVVTVTALSDSDGRPGGTGGAPACRPSEVDDRYAAFSNYAPSTDVVAKSHTVAGPGACIRSTWTGGGYATISGTSMATPHVSGVVALCISSGACTAGASPSSIISAIQTTDAANGFAGDPASPVSGRYYGYVTWLGRPWATAPGAPTLTSATAVSRQVTLQWTPPASTGGLPITGYRIYRGSAGSGSETILTSASASQTSFVDAGVANGTTYWYRVSVVNSVGTGPLSNELAARPTRGVATVTVPGAPTSFTAVAGRRGILLSWSPPASNGGSAIAGYRVYRGTASGTETLLMTVAGTSLTDRVPARGVTYFYYVRAVNAVGEGPASVESSATLT